MNTIQQFADAKRYLPQGWHWLLDILMQQMLTEQSGYMKTLKGEFKKPEKPVCELILHQVKEKFGCLRIYASLERIHHDWNTFDQEEYEVRFMDTNARIMGYIQCLETMSANICERSGQRGTIRNIHGWLKCLSDEEFAKGEN